MERRSPSTGRNKNQRVNVASIRLSTILILLLNIHHAITRTCIIHRLSSHDPRTMCPPSSSCHPRRIRRRKVKMVPIYRYGLPRSLDRTIYDPAQGINAPHQCASRILEVSLWSYPPRTWADLYFSSYMDSDEFQIVWIKCEQVSRYSSDYRVINTQVSSDWGGSLTSLLYVFTHLFSPPCYCISSIFCLGNSIHSHICNGTLSRALADFTFWFFSRSQTQDLC